MSDWRERTDRRVSAEVIVRFKDGTERIETWEGASPRHAVWEARDHYRHQEEVVWVGFASDEPM